MYFVVRVVSCMTPVRVVVGVTVVTTEMEEAWMVLVMVWVGVVFGAFEP